MMHKTALAQCLCVIMARVTLLGMRVQPSRSLSIDTDGKTRQRTAHMTQIGNMYKEASDTTKMRMAS